MALHTIHKAHDESITSALYRFVGIELPEAAFEGICTFLPQLFNYVEEDRRISFKIAMGTEEINSPYGNTYQLNQLPLDPGADSKTVKEQIKGSIKNVVPFCNTFTNVLIRFDPAGNTLNIGIYTTKMDTFRKQDELLLEHGYVIFAPFHDTGVLATKKTGGAYEDRYLPLDCGLKNPIPEKIGRTPDYYSKTCRVWQGLFERVKREVHGTICLVVDEEYRFEDDCDREGDPEEVKNRKHFMNGTAVSVENIVGADSNMELFLSMLNYDGITIINTAGTVIAYHAKSKTSSSQKVAGGMRHQAYSYLRSNEPANAHYVGVYLQSQEGEIEFYDFTAAEDKPFFDSIVMMPVENCNDLYSTDGFDETCGKKKIDSDFADIIGEKLADDQYRFEYLDGQIPGDQPSRSDCETIRGMIHARMEITALLCGYFESFGTSAASGSERKLCESVDAHLDSWKQYFISRFYLNEGLLEHLKKPEADHWVRQLKDCMLAVAEHSSELMIALDSYLLSYNHLEFADMHNELRRQKQSYDWNGLVKALYWN